MEFNALYNETLGEWDMDLISLEIKEGAKPHASKTYPDPRLHKEILKKKYRDCVTLVYSSGSSSQNGPHLVLVP
jgi:hypothetical protein